MTSSAEGTGRRRAIVVSACLLGVRCNHLGEGNPSAAVLALAGSHDLVPICPEVAGGLPTPRPPAIRGPDGRVVTVEGTDVTDSFTRGADAAVALARAVNAERAVLKARSPSCGWRNNGITAAALLAAGFAVGDEDDEGAQPAPRPTMEPPSGA